MTTDDQTQAIDPEALAKAQAIQDKLDQMRAQFTSENLAAKAKEILSGPEEDSRLNAASTLVSGATNWYIACTNGHVRSPNDETAKALNAAAISMTLAMQEFYAADIEEKRANLLLFPDNKDIQRSLIDAEAGLKKWSPKTGVDLEVLNHNRKIKAKQEAKAKTKKSRETPSS
jgi:hypothetical protein